MRLIPKERKFFDHFRKNILNVKIGVKSLRDMITDYSNKTQHAQAVRDREHDGDTMTHELMNTLSKTFVTPIDREDIHSLAGALDDILDYAEEIADTMLLYRIESPTEHLEKMADVLVLAVIELEHAVDKLDTNNDIARHWIEVNTLENEGDKLYRKAVSELFHSNADPLEVIKWKDVYQLMESAIDKCEDAANIIENLVIKHG